MGGTFDPVHLGHIRMGLEAKKELSLEEVWYIPSGIPAYKMNRQEVSLAEHRMNMLKLGVESLEGIRVSDIEMRREGNTYSVDTLRELRKNNPGVHFYFIAGGDSLDYMDTWHEADRLFPLVTIAVFPRADFSEERLHSKASELRRRFGAKVRYLSMEPFPYSSTEIRRLAAERKSLAGLVPEKVEKYIREHHLYSEEEA